MKFNAAHGNVKTDGRAYLLPITMKETSGGIPINDKQQTTYILFQGPNIKIIKSLWQVIDFSSEYQCCNGAYYASQIIDGVTNIVTGGTHHTGYFWLSVGSLPYKFTIDMGKPTLIHGFKIVGNYDPTGGNASYYKRNPKKITLKFSNDGETWKHSQSFTLPFIAKKLSNTKTKITLNKPLTVRYFKLIINTTVGGQAVGNLSEISAF